MISKEDALSRISALVNRFEEQYQTFTNSNYKEAQVRIDFINPFFEALGWDVDNKKGKQLSYREVITEANLLVDESQRAPDYAFCQENGKPIFFLEAKKPSIGLWNTIYPAYQVRRYGWSASLDISIVTDFEEFAVYDCRTMPNSSDQASIERIKYITFKDYLKEFDYLWDNFSKEYCSKETLSKLVVKTGKTKGTDSVDKEFLKSLDRWRTLIAEDIVAQNPNLDVDEINFAVQQTIDRIIFLRIAEDRSVEIYGTLKKCLPDKSAVIPAEGGIQNTVYKKLFDVFREADIKYNSGLFDFKKDSICSKISISDEVLETIIGELYYPKCPYEFSVLAVEILGSAYEQFLGKTITIDEFHRAKIEEKPEVRKAGGVYYTPQYIVDYIVRNTLGKLIGIPGEMGIRNQESGNFVNNIENIDENLQRFGSVGTINDSGGNDIQSDENSSQTGNFRTDKPDSESGGFDTGKYSGRMGQNVLEGTEKILPNSERFSSRTGDSSDNNEPTEIDNQRRTNSYLESTSNSAKIVERYDKVDKRKNKRLNPDSRFLTPDEVSKIKICDPACGSGSFLIGAYQFLLDWHKDYYTKLGKSKALQPDGNLTTAEKKRILLNNIYGVDLDVNAVEVTKLSLLLKCMEGETEASINQQIKIFKERVLPTLDDNIKCGNSLIDIDFYDSQIDFEPGMEKKVKPFNWESAFPSVFGAGGSGFDVVIGNPPYVRIQTIDKSQTNYFKKTYKSAVYGNYDLYVLFIEKMITILKDEKLFGMILPNKFFKAEYGESIRKILSEGEFIYQINDFSTNQIFENATTYTCLLFLSKKRNELFEYQKIELGKKFPNSLISIQKQILNSSKLEGKWNFNSGLKEQIILKLNQQKTTLKDVSRKIFKGSSTGNDDIYLLKLISKQDTFSTCFSTVLNENIDIENKLLKPFIYGSDVRKFFIKDSDIYLLFPYEIEEKPKLIDYNILKEQYPLTANYFDRVRNTLIKRKLEFTKFDFYKYSAGRSLIEYNQVKILIPDMLVESRFGIDLCGNLFHGPAIHSLVINKKFEHLGYYYLTALLGSKLFWFFISNTSTALRGNAYRLTPDYINPFPIVESPDPSAQSQLVQLVETMFILNKDLQKATLQQQKEQLQQRIAYTDKKIDQLVYQLYDLTEEEIKIVEGE